MQSCIWCVVWLFQFDFSGTLTVYEDAWVNGFQALCPCVLYFCLGYNYYNGFGVFLYFIFSPFLFFSFFIFIFILCVLNFALGIMLVDWESIYGWQDNDNLIKQMWLSLETNGKNYTVCRIIPPKKVVWKEDKSFHVSSAWIWGSTFKI